MKTLMNLKTDILFIHLILSFALVFIVSYGGGEIIKSLIMIYAIWLTLKKDARFLPAITVIISFLSNSYVIYLAMIVLAIRNYKEIKYYRIHNLLVILLLFLPLVIYQSLYNVVFHNLKTGLVLNQFQLYFSMFSFFYGVLIIKTFTKKVMRVLILTLFLLYIINFFPGIILDVILVRLTFYIIPFSASCLSYYLFNKRKNYYGYIFIGMLIVFYSGIVIESSTFTIYLTAILAFILPSLYFMRLRTILVRTTGIFSFIIVFSLMAYAITGFKENNYSQFRGMTMYEAFSSFESLSNRVLMKLFEDRAPIWAGTWDGIINSRELLPPKKVNEIKAIHRKGLNKKFEYHSHNIYLELIRTNGIIMGVAVSIIFVLFSLLGRKVFSIHNIDPLFIVLISTSISTMIIGSFTGIYFLSSTYAAFGLTIVGVAFAISRKNHTPIVKIYSLS